MSHEIVIPGNGAVGGRFSVSLQDRKHLGTKTEIVKIDDETGAVEVTTPVDFTINSATVTTSITAADVTATDDLVVGDDASVGGDLTIQGGAVLKYQDTTLSAAQILALHTTPITVVTAPAAGRAAIFEGAILYMDYATTQYAGIAAGDDFVFSYTDAVGQQLSVVEATGFIDQATDQTRWAPQGQFTAGAPGTALLSTSIAPVAAAPIVISLLGAVTTGDSSVKVRVFYRDIPTTL